MLANSSSRLIINKLLTSCIIYKVTFLTKKDLVSRRTTVQAVFALMGLVLREANNSPSAGGLEGRKGRRY